jgi:hypothetical protein
MRRAIQQSRAEQRSAVQVSWVSGYRLHHFGQSRLFIESGNDDGQVLCGRLENGGEFLCTTQKEEGLRQEAVEMNRKGADGSRDLEAARERIEKLVRVVECRAIDQALNDRL